MEIRWLGERAHTDTVSQRRTNWDDRTDIHDVYDPASDSWSKAAPLKTARSAVAAALYRGMIVVDGGELPSEKRTFTENEGYDLKSDKWVALAPMPHGRHGFGAGAIGNNLYFVGGALGPGGSGGHTNELLMFTLP